MSLDISLKEDKNISQKLRVWIGIFRNNSKNRFECIPNVIYLASSRASLAQLVERESHKLEVESSILPGGTFKHFPLFVKFIIV